MPRSTLDPPLDVRLSLQHGLPPIYLTGHFAEQFVSGFDDTLAAVHLVLDCLDAMFDVETAPDDLLVAMAGWLGFELGLDWPSERKRDVTFAVMGMWEGIGTRAGLERVLRAVTGAEVQVIDSGSTRVARSDPESRAGAPTVTIRGLPPGLDIGQILRRFVPAHLRVVLG